MGDSGHTESFTVKEKDGSTSYVKQVRYEDHSGHDEITNGNTKTVIYYGSDGKIKEVQKYSI